MGTKKSRITVLLDIGFIIMFVLFFFFAIPLYIINWYEK